MKNITSTTKQSVRDYWQTQGWFVKQIEEIAKVEFILDPCASESNKKTSLYIDENDNGLEVDWLRYIMTLGDGSVLGAVFVNPPFSQMDKWIDKIILESNRGLRVFMLHPDTSDTAWYQKIEKHCTYQLVPRSRLNYIDPETGKPRNGVNFQSCVSVFTGVHLPSPPRIRFDLEKPIRRVKNKSRIRVRRKK